MLRDVDQLDPQLFEVLWGRNWCLVCRSLRGHLGVTGAESLSLASGLALNVDIGSAPNDTVALYRVDRTACTASRPRGRQSPRPAPQGELTSREGRPTRRRSPAEPSRTAATS